MVRHDGNFVKVRFAGNEYFCRLINFDGQQHSTSLEYYNFRTGFCETVFGITDVRTNTLVELESPLAQIICRQIELCSMMSDMTADERRQGEELPCYPEAIPGLQAIALSSKNIVR